MDLNRFLIRAFLWKRIRKHGQVYLTSSFDVTGYKNPILIDFHRGWAVVDFRKLYWAYLNEDVIQEGLQP